MAVTPPPAVTAPLITVLAMKALRVERWLCSTSCELVGSGVTAPSDACAVDAQIDSFARIARAVFPVRAMGSPLWGGSRRAGAVP